MSPQQLTEAAAALRRLAERTSDPMAMTFYAQEARRYEAQARDRQAARAAALRRSARALASG